jgi:uncharacterized integral membrane protein
MIIPLIIAFLLLLGIVIISVQNMTPVALEFITWKLEMSLAAVIFYSSLVGAAILAILTLPKLALKYLNVRRFRREISELKKKIVEVEKQNVGNTPAD